MITTNFDAQMLLQCPVCLELPKGPPVITRCCPFKVENGVPVVMPGPVTQHMTCKNCFYSYRAEQLARHPNVLVCCECRGSVESFEESLYLERLIGGIVFTCSFCGSKMDRAHSVEHELRCPPPAVNVPVPVLPMVPAVLPPPAPPVVLPHPPARRVVYISDDDDEPDNAMDVDRDDDIGMLREDAEIHNEYLCQCVCVPTGVSVRRPVRSYSNRFLSRGIVWGSNFRPATNEAEIGRRLSSNIRDGHIQPLWLDPERINTLQECKIILAYNALDGGTEFVLASIVDGGRRDRYSGYNIRIGQDAQLDLLE